MKLRLIPLLLLPLTCGAKEQKELPSLTDNLIEGKIWSKKLTDVFDEYAAKEDDNENEISKELREKLEKEGITISKGPKKGFQWLSSKKRGLRATGGKFSMLDKPVGEVVIRGNEDAITAVTVSVFNRGDDGMMKRSEYETKLETWKDLLTEKVGVRPSSRDDKGVVKTTGWMWKKGKVAFLLEGSISKKSNRAEFIRLRIAPVTRGAKLEKVARRSEIKNNVRKKDNGDVWIEGIPMVDQGQKGYCVVASIERVGRYYGLKLDQHEMAQLADTTSGGGTSPKVMEEAFKKITGKIHVRTNKMIDYDYKQTVKDLKAYDREAKKQGAHVFNIDLDTHYVIAQGFWSNADKNVFKKVKGKQSRYKFFKSKVQTYIDRGIPICWSLYLGMFPEKGLPQSWGGHMRIIHGYNNTTEEIIYTDSWGDGHEMKRMPAVEAWCMTLGVYAMIPTN